MIVCFLLMATVPIIAQTPVSHQAGVTFTYSGSYYATGGGASVNFLMCDSWNSGTYGGWLQMDLGTSITLESLRWWVGMLPNGNIASELVEVSANGVDWTLAANTSGPHVVFEEIKLLFDPVIPNVRYIRISQSGTPSWFSILEMIVNEPFYADNIYSNMPPKLLDNLGNELTDPVVAGFPFQFVCSKADSYQWYKNGVIIDGATNQGYLANDEADYACAVTYSTANCGYSISSSPIPLALPVDLLSFDVVAEKNNARLNWEIANPINFSHFEIERSLDGIEFEQIDQIKSRGEGSYTYLDKNLLTGTVYYQLKMVDNDSQFKYTPMDVLHINRRELKVYPNPVSDLLYITSDQDNYDFYIYDFSGRLVYQGKALEKSIGVSVADLPTGLYYFKMDGQSIKFMVE